MAILQGYFSRKGKKTQFEFGQRPLDYKTKWMFSTNQTKKEKIDTRGKHKTVASNGIPTAVTQFKSDDTPLWIFQQRTKLGDAYLTT